MCPDVIILLGEDLTRFRDASKELFSFLRTFSWNGRVERLGFDEVCELELVPQISPLLRSKRAMLQLF